MISTNINIEYLNDEISNLNWDDLYLAWSKDYKESILTNKLSVLHDKHVPIR